MLGDAILINISFWENIEQLETGVLPFAPLLCE
jgi:hypothetical protein